MSEVSVLSLVIGVIVMGAVRSMFGELGGGLHGERLMGSWLTDGGRVTFDHEGKVSIEYNDDAPRTILSEIPREAGRWSVRNGQLCVEW